jgi:hypothetical protein
LQAGIFLIVSGIAVAVMGLRETAVQPVATEVSQPVEPVLTASVLHASPPPVSAVASLPGKSTITEKPAPSPTISSAPPTGATLVDSLQRELTRVGCYGGAADGLWSGSTRKAMKAFIERVNAKLPTGRPDLVLLALVQGHQGLACGNCSAGEEPSANGRCLRKALVARAEGAGPGVLEAPLPLAASDQRLPPAAAARQGKTVRSAYRSPPPIEGRMSIGARAIAPQPPERDVKLATVEPVPGPQAAQPRKERRAARHGRRHVASLRSRGYLGPMRQAYRPFRRSRGIAALFFGIF